MPDTTANNVPPGSRAVRTVADDYVRALADLEPTVATALGLRPDEDRLPDLSPAGHDALDDLARSTLAGLTSAEGAAEAAGNGARGQRRQRGTARTGRRRRAPLRAAAARAAQRGARDERAR